MSDQPMGPGWWQASDYKWYPPQPQPVYVPPPKQKSKVPLVIGIICIVLVVGMGGCALIATLAVGRAARETTANDARVVDESGSATPTSAGDGGSAGPAGSRTSPLALGTEVDLGNGWKVKVISAELGAAAAPAIAAANPFNEPAPAGSRFILVNLQATYTGNGRDDTEAPALGMGVSAFGSAGVERNSYDALVVPPEPRFDVMSDLAIGGVASGNIVIKVGADESDLVLRVRPTLSFDDTEAWLALQ